MSEIKQLTEKNFRIILKSFMKINELSNLQIAKLIEDHSDEKMIEHLLEGKIFSYRMMHLGLLLFVLGFEKYAILSTAERQVLLQEIAHSSGTIIEFDSIIPIITIVHSTFALVNLKNYKNNIKKVLDGCE